MTDKNMTGWKNAGLVFGGFVLGTLGVKALTSKPAKKAYAHVTAAALRVKDDTVVTVTKVREGCGDILADAKEINAKRQAAEDAAVVEDAAVEETAEETEA